LVLLQNKFITMHGHVNEKMHKYVNTRLRL